jgi:arylsulfatase A-like enzyme
MDVDARTRRLRVFGVTHSIHNMTVGDPGDTLQYLWCVDDEWKLILRFDGQDTTEYRNVHAWDTAPIHLYDIASDPNEMHDLAARKPEVVARLKQEIDAWAKSQSAAPKMSDD